MNKTTGIILTVVTALCCGCFALFSCIFGGMIAAGTPFNQTINGVESVETYPQPIGFALLCLSLIFIIIPIVVGFFTLRKKPAPAAENLGEPLPPTS
jgi:TRAP-type C4-dicarboxylate transport system permease small subunit